MKKALFIITSDLHLTLSSPVSRMGSIENDLVAKLSFVTKTQKTLKIPVLDAGDLFHKATKSNELINIAMKYLPDDFYTMPGNHDLVNHSYTLFDKTCFSVLVNAGIIFCQSILDFKNIHVRFFGYGEEMQNHVIESEQKNITIAVTHQMILEKQNKIVPGILAKDLLDDYNYDVIISGHNHQSFVVEHNDKILINPGCMLRLGIDEADYEPSFYVLYDDLSVERMYYPAEKNIFDVEKHTEKKERDSRIQAFIEGIQDFEIGTSFKRNIENYFVKNKTKQSIQEIVLGTLEE